MLFPKSESLPQQPDTFSTGSGGLEGCLPLTLCSGGITFISCWGLCLIVFKRHSGLPLLTGIFQPVLLCLLFALRFRFPIVPDSYSKSRIIKQNVSSYQGKSFHSLGGRGRQLRATVRPYLKESWETVKYLEKRQLRRKDLLRMQFFTARESRLELTAVSSVCSQRGRNECTHAWCSVSCLYFYTVQGSKPGHAAAHWEPRSSFIN